MKNKVRKVEIAISQTNENRVGSENQVGSAPPIRHPITAPHSPSLDPPKSLDTHLGSSDLIPNHRTRLQSPTHLPLRSPCSLSTRRQLARSPPQLARSPPRLARSRPQFARSRPQLGRLAMPCGGDSNTHCKRATLTTSPPMPFQTGSGGDRTWRRAPKKARRRRIAGWGLFHLSR